MSFTNVSLCGALIGALRDSVQFREVTAGGEGETACLLWATGQGTNNGFPGRLCAGSSGIVPELSGMQIHRPCLRLETQTLGRHRDTLQAIPHAGEPLLWDPSFWGGCFSTYIWPPIVLCIVCGHFHALNTALSCCNRDHVACTEMKPLKVTTCPFAKKPADSVSHWRTRADMNKGCLLTGGKKTRRTWRPLTLSAVFLMKSQRIFQK